MINKLNNTNTGESINPLKDVQENFNKEMVIKIEELIAKNENIAIKIVKGESLTSEEKEFINNNYPQLKEFATKTHKESNALRVFIEMNKLDEIQNTDINNLELHMINKLNNLNLSNNDLELNNIYKNKELNNANAGELKGEISNTLKDVQENYNKEMVIKIKEMIAKAENIAIKIVKGESLTSKEKEFINKNYPKLKEFATKTYKESNELKNFIKMSKLGEIQNTEKDINDLINNEKVKNNTLFKDCKITTSEWKIKEESINQVEKYFVQIKKDLSKLENILLKFIKGKNLTSEENEFIDKKYPKSKDVANDIKREYESLKSIVKECKSGKELDEIISKEISKLKKGENIEQANKENTLKTIVTKLKKDIINEVIKSSKQTIKNEEVDLKKFENIKENILKGEKITLKELKFIQSKNPQIKQIVEETVKEVIDSSLKKENNNLKLDKKAVMLKLIEDTKENGSKGLLSELEVKIKLLILEDEDDIYSKIVNPESIYALNPFVYFKTKLMSYSLICLGIAGVILVVSLILHNH
ncbi:MAG TPA: hypothetical protein DDY58_14355 [Terrisporobacter glycolicus]|uniref:hypothetical protein n=1 Tax=Terrisporobacter TaxID=1505652 RepID=UPI000E7E89B3|nr:MULTISPECIES: hypothetical protein [Terrisporobacter]HBI93498.1 hypothetical protein [Terrisporobacter hibernicus]